MRFTLNGVEYELTEKQVRNRLSDVRSEHVHHHGVRIDNRVFPVKQAFEVATGRPRTEFTSHTARRHLASLGFELVGVIQSRASSLPPLASPTSVDGVRASTPETVTAEWHTESSIQAMLVAYLVNDDWRIISVANTQTRQQGIDIVAERSNATLAVEVKGYPSRNYADPSRSQERKPTQPSNQAVHWYAQAVLTAMRTRSRHSEARSVIALPAFKRYQDLYAETAGSLHLCGIELWWVSQNGQVTLGALPSQI